MGAILRVGVVQKGGFLNSGVFYDWVFKELKSPTKLSS